MKVLVCPIVHNAEARNHTVVFFDCRVLIEDGTGEAHLYVKGRDIPVALGMRDREWSDLLDLVHKLGQISYTKSSRFKVCCLSKPQYI